MNLFTYEEYKNLLNEMKKINKIYTFKEASSKLKSGIILRHDIDFDIQKAYVFSKIEKEKGVTSTYFVLTTSDVYNPSSANNRILLKKMYNDGFEIGLHFDPSIYESKLQEELAKKVKIECAILEDIIGDKVNSISLHHPATHNLYPYFEGYKNAYAKEFFKPDYYISDSARRFRGKNIYNFIKKGKDNLIQVLLHPIHFSSKEANYVQAFNSILRNRIENFDDEYRRINKTYNEEVKNKKLLWQFNDFLNKLIIK